MPSIDALEKRIGHRFKNKELLITALTHASYTSEKEKKGSHTIPISTENYERLEFLGDAILNAVISCKLFEVYPHVREGQLATYKALLVQESFLAQIAEKLNLAHHLLLSQGEQKGGGSKKTSILADVVEAITGAIYIDSTFRKAFNCILSWLPDDLTGYIDNKLKVNNPKGRLQEILQQVFKSQEGNLVYEVLAQDGPSHLKTFEVAVKYNNVILGTGSGSSKKKAEEIAALNALSSLQEKKFD